MFRLFNRIPSITTAELEQRLSGTIVLLDVRTASEYKAGHIAKAKNIPLDKIGAYSGEKESPVYLICQSGARSKKAATILNKKGYHVINVRGGMSQWSGKIRGGK